MNIKELISYLETLPEDTQIMVPEVSYKFYEPCSKYFVLTEFNIDFLGGDNPVLRMGEVV